MSLLENLRTTADLFHANLPPKPAGKYVHFLLIRETESFPLFQTDGSLNVIRVRAGLRSEHQELITRLMIFKRKQSSPERLTGRELLRAEGIIADEGERRCEYNSAEFCKRCPDCVLYGYAIGDQGAEKSKVYVDTAYSITPYEISHKALSFNALYEHGTMTQQGSGQTRSSFGEQDHVVPQVFFPSIVTLRDPTYPAFLYVLGNLLRTERYGAQETRTGRVYNHLVGVVFANGEIFSNLRWTQAIYDRLPQHDDLLEREAVLRAAQEAYGALIEDEPVVRPWEQLGAEAAALCAEVTALYRDAGRSRALLQALAEQTRAYAAQYGPDRKTRK